MRATIDQEGRIALAPELQTQLGVHPGDEVVVEHHDGKWIIQAATSETGLCFEGNVLVHRGVTPASCVDPLAIARNERCDQLGEGLPQ